MSKKGKKQAKAALDAPAPHARYGGGASLAGQYGLGEGRIDQSPSSFIFGWRPHLREPFHDVREGWLGAAARAVDAIQNSGFLAGAVEQATGQMIGSGLMLDAKPDLSLFGGSEAAAETWAGEVESKFNAWARSPWECDLGGRFTFGQIQDQAVRQYFATGEIVGTLPAVLRPGNRYAVKVNLLPSMRLVQDTVVRDPAQVQGVVLGPNYEPMAYVFWASPVLSTGEWRQETVPARTGGGRQIVFHIFTGDPGCIRGITPLAPALKVIRQVDQLADGTLTAALLQTIFAATVQSDAPTVETMRALQGIGEQDDNPDLEGAPPGSFQNLLANRYDWYRQTRIDLGTFGKIAHMFPGEELKFNTTQLPNQNYEAFHRALLREIARDLCVSYEAMSGDYSFATYSASRQAAADLWPLNLKRRAFYPARLCGAVYEAWLEEAIEIGDVAFPGGVENFRANRSMAVNANWRGPPPPIADDLKTAKANQILRAEGLVSRSQLSAQMGFDFAEVQKERAREDAEDARLGLAGPPNLSSGVSSADAAGAQQESGDNSAA